MGWNVSTHQCRFTDVDSRVQHFFAPVRDTITARLLLVKRHHRNFATKVVRIKLERLATVSAEIQVGVDLHFCSTLLSWSITATGDSMKVLIVNQSEVSEFLQMKECIAVMEETLS